MKESIKLKDVVDSCETSRLTIDIPAVSDGEDRNHLFGIVDGVKDPIILNPQVLTLLT